MHISGFISFIIHIVVEQVCRYTGFTMQNRFSVLPLVDDSELEKWVPLQMYKRYGKEMFGSGGMSSPLIGTGTPPDVLPIADPPADVIPIAAPADECPLSLSTETPLWQQDWYGFRSSPGYKLVNCSGWEEGQGLGRSGAGKNEPIVVKSQKSRAGVGFRFGVFRRTANLDNCTAFKSLKIPQVAYQERPTHMPTGVRLQWSSYNGVHYAKIFSNAWSQVVKGERVSKGQLKWVNFVKCGAL